MDLEQREESLEVDARGDDGRLGAGFVDAAARAPDVEDADGEAAAHVDERAVGRGAAHAARLDVERVIRDVARGPDAVARWIAHLDHVPREIDERLEVDVAEGALAKIEE